MVEYDDFCQGLAQCRTKWEEDELLGSREWKDMRVLAYLDMMGMKSSIFAVDSILNELQSDAPQWVIPMVEADFENKSVELFNTMEKTSVKGSKLQRDVASALLSIFNDDQSGSIIPVPVEELAKNDDPVMQYLALQELLDAKNVNELLPFEDFVEAALSNKNPMIAEAALKVLERTECKENRDVIEYYRKNIKMASPREDLGIVNVAEGPFVGDWYPLTLESLDAHTTASTGSRPKSILFGLE